MEKTKIDFDNMSAEEFRQGQLEWIKTLRPCDDVLMSQVFLYKEVVECVLKPILKLTDLEIVKVETQRPVPGIEPDARGIRFDVLAWDKNGCPYNIEIQRDRRGMSIKRTRLYSGAVDLLASSRGMDFDDEPDSFEIVICGFDMFKRGKPIYTERIFIDEIGEFVNKGRHVKYVNAPLLMKSPDTELGRLMCDLWCADPKKMYNRTLADVVSYCKEGKGVEELMEVTGFMGEYLAYREAKAEIRGEARGEAKGKLGTSMQYLRTMMRRHQLSADEAMDELEVSSEDRQELKKLLLQESANPQSDK